MVTSNQPLTELQPLEFYAVSSISAWAGKTNDIHYVGGDVKLPYTEKDGRFYYFGQYETGYQLICSSPFDFTQPKDG